MINFTSQVSIDSINLLKPVIKGCLNTLNTNTRHIAYHYCVVLLLSRIILLSKELLTPMQNSSGVLSKIVDLPNSLEIKIDTIQHYKLTNKQVTEFLKTRETV